MVILNVQKNIYMFQRMYKKKILRLDQWKFIVVYYINIYSINDNGNIVGFFFFFSFLLLIVIIVYYIALVMYACYF